MPAYNAINKLVAVCLYFLNAWMQSLFSNHGKKTIAHDANITNCESCKK